MLVTSTDTRSTSTILDSPNAPLQEAHGSNNISRICLPLQYIEFTNDPRDIFFTKNIVTNNAKKHSQITLTPASKRNDTEEVISFIPIFKVSKQHKPNALNLQLN